MTHFGLTPISIGDLLGRLEDRMKLLSGLPADCVFLSAATENWHLKCPPADQFIVLFPESFPVWQGVVTGAGQSFQEAPGEENLGFDLSLKTVIFTRLNTDQEFRSSDLFRNTTLGIAGITNRMLKAYQIWTVPTDDDPDISYLREPSRITGGPTVSHREYEKTFWTLLTTKWEFKFTTTLN